MKLIYKAFRTCYGNMSPLFKAILKLGFGVFLLQQLTCGILNVWYIAQGYMNIDLKNLADICFQGSYTLLALVSLVCIFGDYVRDGFGPKN